MKNFVCGSLLTILVSGAAGCIISSDDSGAFCGDGIVDPGESCDDGNNVSGDGCTATCDLEQTPHTTTATWKIQNVDGSAGGCPTGFDTAIVVSWKVDASGHTIGNCVPGQTPSDSCYLDIFDCAAGTGTTGPIPDTTKFPSAVGGKFLTYVAITNHAGSSVYAESLSDVENLTSSNASFPSDAEHEHGTIYKNGGRFALNWELNRAGSAISCSAAQSGGVSVISTLTGPNTAVDDTFNCSDGEAGVVTTGGLLAGTYTVSVSALDMSSPGAALGAPTNLASKVIQSPAAAECSPADCVTDLGMVQLDAGP